MSATQHRTLMFYYTLADVDLACEIEYTPPCPGSRQEGQQMEPDEPEEFDLVSASVGGVDIVALLSDKQVAEIEDAFLNQDRSD